MRRAAPDVLGWLLAAALAVGARAWFHLFSDTLRGRL